MDVKYIKEAFDLLFSFDAEIYQIIFLSLMLAITASLLALVFGTFFGILISSSTFKGKRLIKKIIFTFMGVPPVVLGTFVLLMAIGPLENMNIIFNYKGMFIAQFLLVLPIVTGNIIVSTEKTQKDVLETASMLGAKRKDKIFLLIGETKPFIFLSFVLAFSRAISEVGAVMIIGGSIKGKTRTLTTEIARTVSMGEYGSAIAIGIVLLVIAFIIHSLLSTLRGDFYD